MLFGEKQTMYYLLNWGHLKNACEQSYENKQLRRERMSAVTGNRSGATNSPSEQGDAIFKLGYCLNIV